MTLTEAMREYLRTSSANLQAAKVAVDGARAKMDAALAARRAAEARVAQIFGTDWYSLAPIDAPIDPRLLTCPAWTERQEAAACYRAAHQQWRAAMDAEDRQLSDALGAWKAQASCGAPAAGDPRSTGDD
jgi:hypothetical protein